MEELKNWGIYSKFFEQKKEIFRGIGETSSGRKKSGESKKVGETIVRQEVF